MFPKTSKILIVDDMKTMRIAMKNALKKLGFENLAEADDGATAWPKITEAASGGEPFSLIFSDWNMPKVQGIELLKKVRGTPAVATTPFIMVTAESEKHQIMSAIHEGVSQYVTKPFTADVLKDKIVAVYNKTQK